MDEPCSALDPIVDRAGSRRPCCTRSAATRSPIVIVTHNMQQAARASDITAFFLGGELVESAETKDLFTSPRDKRTEDYITGKFG